MFLACGLNHKSASLDAREKIASLMTDKHTLLQHLYELAIIHEVVILSTCNRTEIYCETHHPERVIQWFKELSELAEEHLYFHFSDQGIRHMLRVASGLDSMMLGEPQILGQMKQAFQEAQQAGTVQRQLRLLFQFIFQASKRIRTESDIGKNSISVAFAAVQWIGQQCAGNYSALKVFIIGSGETATLVAKYLQKQGVSQFMVASRTQDHATTLSLPLGAQALTISDIPQYLGQADIVISATTCPLPFITKSWVEHALEQREQAPMFFLDLAVPRDIETQVGSLPNVTLYNIDDLKDVVEQGVIERRSAAHRAELIIERETEAYARKERVRKSNHLICDYRNKMQRIAAQELERSLRKISAGQTHTEALLEFSQRLVSKLSHPPTMAIRKAAWDGQQELLELAHSLLSEPLYEKIP